MKMTPKWNEICVIQAGCGSTEKQLNRQMHVHLSESLQPEGLCVGDLLY